MIDMAAFPRMFYMASINCLLSNKLFTSSANDDIVVKEPQNPIPKKKEYLGSRLNVMDKIENTPKIKLPMTLTIKTFSGSPPKRSGGNLA